MIDYGINDDFIKSIGDTLKPDTSALFLLVRKSSPRRFWPSCTGTGTRDPRPPCHPSRRPSSRPPLSAHPPEPSEGVEAAGAWPLSRHDTRRQRERLRCCHDAPFWPDCSARCWPSRSATAASTDAEAQPRPERRPRGHGPAGVTAPPAGRAPSRPRPGSSGCRAAGLERPPRTLGLGVGPVGPSPGRW